MYSWLKGLWNKTIPGAEASVRWSVIWLTALFLFLLWAIFGTWSYSQWQEVSRTQEHLMERNRLAVETEVHGIFKAAQVFLLNARQWIKNHPKDNPLKNDYFVTMVESFQRATNESIVVRLINKDGMSQLISSGSAELSTDGRYLDYVAHALRQTREDALPQVYIGQPYRGAVTGRLGIPVTMPLERPIGNIAMVQTQIDLDTLQQNLSKRTFSHAGAIVLLHRKGYLLANAPGSGWRRGNPVGNWNELDKALGEFATGILRNYRLDQGTLWLAYGATTEFPLVVVVAEGEGSIFAQWYRTFWILAALFMLASLVTLISARRALNLLRDLEESRQELQLMAVTDILTGLYNRRYYYMVCEIEWERARRYGRPYSLIMFDIDFFKNVNDKPDQGHAAGDEVLINLAKTCSIVLREHDVLCRLGGEEFGVMLPETREEGAMLLAERLRRCVQDMVTRYKSHQIKITISLGVAQNIPEEDSFAKLESRADEALFKAKRDGRNRVCRASKEATPAAEVSDHTAHTLEASGAPEAAG